MKAGSSIIWTVIKISESCFLESLLLVSVDDDHFDCVR